MRVQSQISICNRALAHMGQTRFIRSLDEGSEEAETLRLHYDPVRRSLLSYRAWRFATMVSPLPKFTATVPGWSNVYALPAGCLRVLAVFGAGGAVDSDCGGAPFEVLRLSSGRAIVSDVPDAVGRCISDVTDPLEFPSLFCDALSWRLALEICAPLTSKAALRDNLAAHYMEALRCAVDADAAEFCSSLPEWGDDYIRARD